ncbi:MAG: VTT domain-containing protein [Brevefilum sp.]
MIEHLRCRLISNDFLSNPHNIARIVLILIIITAAIFVSLNYTLADIQDYIQANPRQTIIISLLIYISFGLTFFPSIPLTLFIAVLIGPLQAAIVATVGNTLAALLEYQVGKTIGDVVDFDRIKSKLPLGLGKLPIKSPYFLLAARSIPAGTRGFSLVCGAYQVPLVSYTWTTFTMYFISSLVLAFGSVGLIRFF